jgi:crossover junction endodeoxyribonuclease RusA
MIELQLPLPPSTNRIWRSARGRVFKSPEYRAWLQECGLHVDVQRPGRIDGHYALTVLATRPDRRRRDLDNLLKPVGDALRNTGIIEDDSLCDSINATWISSGAGMTVRVRSTQEID